MSYILQLRKVLFNEFEQKNNFKITILRDNKPNNENQIAMASAIFTINKDGFETNPNSNIYFYFNPTIGLIPISKDKLENDFNNNILAYIEEKDPKGPGINTKGGQIK